MLLPNPGKQLHESTSASLYVVCMLVIIFSVCSGQGDDKKQPDYIMKKTEEQYK